jgi:site-specific DNA recombinase
VIALYLRISLDRADQQVGIARQRADCTKLARTRWPDTPIVEYVDNDVSAYSGVKRPAYESLLAGLSDRSVQGVVAYNLDRLLRQPRDLEQLIDRGIPIITAQGDLDLTTHDGQLHARILAAVAKKSSDDTARRVSRAAKDRREEGRWHGGRHVPFGYVTRGHGVLEIDPAAAAIVTRVARAVVAGQPLARAIRENANGAGPRSREGWRQLLVGSNIRGRQRDGSAGNWQPIIDDELANLLSIQLATARRENSYAWPLSGYAWCHCSGRLYGQVCRGDATYFCRTCMSISISARPLETLIEAALDSAVLVIPRPAVAKPAVDDSRLAELAALYVRGEITKAEWAAARVAVEDHGRDAVNLSAHQGPHVVGDRREIQPVDASGWGRLVVIERVVVSPARTRGPRFDTSRVHIEWRS